MRSMIPWVVLCLVVVLGFAVPAGAAPSETKAEREFGEVSGWLNWLEGMWDALVGQPPTGDDPLDQSGTPDGTPPEDEDESDDEDRGTLDPDG